MHLVETPLIVPVAAPSVPRFFGFGYAGFCQSAMEVGGDFFEVCPLSESSLLLAVADVMGKGSAAALFAGTLRTLVHAVVVPNLCPARTLRELNELMFEQLSAADMFITLQLAVADLHQRQLHVANAGHCPLLISSPNQPVLAVAPEGIPLGICPDAHFSPQTVQIDSFSSILMYTDGVTESRDSGGSFFGQPRLEHWFGRALAQDRTAAELKRSLLRELFRFQGRQQASDDQTFLILSDETPRLTQPQPPDASRWFLPWTYGRRAARPAHT
jgi:sigma-B regulation protein RsbU (phosphoserine phosphatase)